MCVPIRRGLLHLLHSRDVSVGGSARKIAWPLAGSLSSPEDAVTAPRHRRRGTSSTFPRVISVFFRIRHETMVGIVVPPCFLHVLCFPVP